jgi:predicted helicase
MPKIFPDGCENIILWTTGIGASVPFSCWISAKICSIQQGPAAVQHFPLYLYETIEEAGEGELFVTPKSSAPSNHTRRDAITDTGLAHFQQAYPAKGEGESLNKEDLFYYIYGLLHSPDYRSRYADNLSKELPRIPAVKAFADFRAFSQAGRDLAHWHLNYETVACHPGVAVEEVLPASQTATDADRRYRVTKMKYGKTKDANGKNVNDKSTVIYNEFITLKDIPLAAYDYVVNGKPALEWVMERQSVTTDDGKGGSGIVNDANLWATETMGNAKYPLELFQRVVTVSLETMKLVNGLPALEIQNAETATSTESVLAD